MKRVIFILAFVATVALAGVATKAHAVVIDTFNSSTLDSSWVPSTVLDINSSTATAIWDTTTNPGKLTGRWTSSSGLRQFVLLRSYTLNVGDYLETELSQTSDTFHASGLYVTTATGVTDRNNAVSLVLENASYTDPDLGMFVWGAPLGISGNYQGVDKSHTFMLRLERTTDASYTYLFKDLTAGDVDFTLLGTSGGSFTPGAIGYFHYSSGVDVSPTLIADNLAVNGSIVPEPSTTGLIVMAACSLLCYAWRKRK